jgi:hypothetical protein
MDMNVSETLKKATLIPIDHVAWDLELPQPLAITETLTFENVQKLLKPQLFTLWKEMISKRELDDLARSPFAIIHHFQSSGHIGREEAESDDLAFKVFLCCFLIKPIRSGFQRIQLKFTPSGEPEVFSFTHPPLPPNVPDSESLNVVELDDIRRLRRLLPSFLKLASQGPEHVRRAVRHYNVGYLEVRDPTIQIVVWTMGIESLFTMRKEQLSAAELTERIGETVGLKTRIYEGSPMQQYINQEIQEITVGEVIADLLTLRNRFVHGLWIPEEWKDRNGRNSFGGAYMNYADLLREAASFILRRGILKYLEQAANAKQTA